MEKSCQKKLRRKKSCQLKVVPEKSAGGENRAKKVMREKLKSTVKETDVVKKKLDEPLGGTNWAQYDVAVSSQACLRQLKDTFRGVSRAV